VAITKLVETVLGREQRSRSPRDAGRARRATLRYAEPLLQGRRGGRRSRPLPPDYLRERVDGEPRWRALGVRHDLTCSATLSTSSTSAPSFPIPWEYGLGARASCWIKQRRQKAIREGGKASPMMRLGVGRLSCSILPRSSPRCVATNGQSLAAQCYVVRRQCRSHDLTDRLTC
jgi:hypothetical protein